MASASPAGSRGTERACQVVLKLSQRGLSSYAWATPEGSPLSNAVAYWQEQCNLSTGDTPTAGKRRYQPFKGDLGRDHSMHYN